MLSVKEYKCDHTPIIVCPDVDGDVMDAVYANQVHPPGGGFSYGRHCYSTLTSIQTQV